MPRARNIKPAFFTNEYLAELSFEARLLFIGLWTLADRRGRLEDRPKGIKGKLFPYENLDIDAFLKELADSPETFIIRYEVNGKRYIQITNFGKHQNPHMKESESTIPAPCLHDADTIQDQDKHDTSRADSLNLIPDSPLLIPDTLNPRTTSTDTRERAEVALSSRRKKPPTLSKAQTERFNQFWAAYPRKASLGDAEKAWIKISPDDELTETIIAAVTRAKQCDERFREEKYTPHPASWLNGKGWLDEQPNMNKSAYGADGMPHPDGGVWLNGKQVLGV